MFFAIILALITIGAGYYIHQQFSSTAGEVSTGDGKAEGSNREKAISKRNLPGLQSKRSVYNTAATNESLRSVTGGPFETLEFGAEPAKDESSRDVKTACSPTPAELPQSYAAAAAHAVQDKKSSGLSKLPSNHTDVFSTESERFCGELGNLSDSTARISFSHPVAFEVKANPATASTFKRRPFIVSFVILFFFSLFCLAQCNRNVKVECNASNIAINEKENFGRYRIHSDSSENLLFITLYTEMNKTWWTFFFKFSQLCLSIIVPLVMEHFDSKPLLGIFGMYSIFACLNDALAAASYWLPDSGFAVIYVIMVILSLLWLISQKLSGEISWVSFTIGLSSIYLFTYNCILLASFPQETTTAEIIEAIYGAMSNLASATMCILLIIKNDGYLLLHMRCFFDEEISFYHTAETGGSYFLHKDGNGMISKYFITDSMIVEFQPYAHLYPHPFLIITVVPRETFSVSFENFQDYNKAAAHLLFLKALI